MYLICIACSFLTLGKYFLFIRSCSRPLLSKHQDYTISHCQFLKMSVTAHKSPGYNRKKNNDTVGRLPNISVLHMIVIDYQCHLKTSYHRLLQSSNEYFREAKAFLQKFFVNLHFKSNRVYLLYQKD